MLLKGVFVVCCLIVYSDIIGTMGGHEIKAGPVVPGVSREKFNMKGRFGVGRSMEFAMPAV